MGWFWDGVKIIGPCITWEFCFKCGYLVPAYWKSGKKPYFATMCDCGARNYTLVVIAQSN